MNIQTSYSREYSNLLFLEVSRSLKLNFFRKIKRESHSFNTNTFFYIIHCIDSRIFKLAISRSLKLNFYRKIKPESHSFNTNTFSIQVIMSLEIILRKFLPAEIAARIAYQDRAQAHPMSVFLKQAIAANDEYQKWFAEQEGYECPEFYDQDAQDIVFGFKDYEAYCKAMKRSTEKHDKAIQEINAYIEGDEEFRGFGRRNQAVWRFNLCRPKFYEWMEAQNHNDIAERRYITIKVE